MSLETLAEQYNILGLSKPKEVSLQADGWSLHVSNVGMNIMGSTFKGTTFHTFGPEPFVTPAVDKYGNVSVDLPLFYRWIGHFGVTSAFNDLEITEIDPEVVERTKALTGIGIDEKYFFGHHGDNQVAFYDVQKFFDENLGLEVIVGERKVAKNEFNPYEFTVRKTIYVEKKELVEITEFLNHTSEPILASQIYHPYISIPGGVARFDGLNIFVDKGNIRREIYDGKKKRVNDIQVPLPVAGNGEELVIESQAGKKKRVAIITFFGDYNRLNNYPNGEVDREINKASLGIFSPGSNRNELSREMSQKLSLYYQELRLTVSNLKKAGYEPASLGLPDLAQIEEIEERVSRQILSNIRSLGGVAIEDLTSGGYALRTLEGLNKAIYLNPGESFRTERRTRVYYH